MNLIFRYAGPVLVALLCLAAICIWAEIDRKRAEAQALSELRSFAGAISGALQGSIQTDIRGGGLRRGRLSNIFQDVVTTSGLRFILLRQGDDVLASAGSVPDGLKLAGESGAELTDKAFIYWHTVRLQDCSSCGKGKGKGAGRMLADHDITLDSSQLFIIGLNTIEYKRKLETAGRGRFTVMASSSIAVFVLAGAWIISTHSRRLRMQLQVAHAKAEHLEELGLAAAGLAHETKNPLGIIRGLAQQIQDSASDAEKKDFAGSIMEAADVASARLGDFLQYARMRDPKLINTDLDKMFRRMKELLMYDFKSSGVELALKPSGICILADTEMLEQVMMNLLLNAVNVSHPGGQVSVKAEAGHSGVSISVKDDGSGIKPDFLPEIFKPYVTGSSTGHGMGLAIVRRIIDVHGWSIKVDSSPGCWTCFVISGILQTPQNID